MNNKITCFWHWLSSRGEIDRPKKDAKEKFQMSIRVTAKCRFNAAERLKRQSKFAFFTTTILSLGLIFIPLMQNSGIQLAFPPNVLNMISTFLAVAVLVYSVVIGTARYEARADKLTQCGDNLKDLNRELDNQSKSASVDIQELEKKYSHLISDTENHTKTDYLAATLEMRRDYAITGFPRLYKRLLIIVVELFSYIIPLSMLALEIVFILDMLGISHILAKYFSNL
ncbi:SLATT domain-containing protein [Haemophilus haemolyticus]|uniref:SLATT domain-containing protein n=1 Tax=Haemophilus haemolyticus TaxID=726 RepID=UPI000E58EF48|nr:SLATT domain-containing protein [Haemophilus haemolyticus]